MEKRKRPQRRRRWHRHAPLVLVVGPLVAILGVIALTRLPAVQRLAKVARFRVQAAIRPATAKTALRLTVPFHRQERALSCEVATLRMALGYYGVDETEAKLLELLPFSSRSRRGSDNTWGDPDVGFVGDVDGKMPNTGYGVYETPIAALAQRYRPARALRGATVTTVLEAVAGLHPVIVWGNTGSGRDISWRTPEGKIVFAIDGEHTRVVTGFTGTPTAPERILLLDPIYGEITMTAAHFQADWARLGNRAVVVY